MVRDKSKEHQERRGVQDAAGNWINPKGQEHADEGFRQGRLVGGGFGGGGGPSGGNGEGGMPGGAVSKELFNFVGQIKVNTDKMVWTLIDIVHAIRGDKLKQIEKKRESGNDKPGWKKTAGIAITGGLGIAGAIAAAKALGEGYAAKKAAQKLLQAKAKAKLAKKLKLENIAKEKADKLAKEQKAKADKIAKDKADRLAKEQKAKDRAERERKANEKKANEKKKLEQQKKKLAEQKALDKKKALDAQSKASKKKLTKASTKEVGMIKKFFRTLPLKDIKTWITTLKVAGTVSKAKANLLALGPAGVVAFFAFAAAEYIAFSQLMQILAEVEKEKQLEETKKVEKLIKDAEKLVNNKSVIQKMKPDFNKIRRQQMEANLQKKWGPKFYDYQQYNDVMSKHAGADWHTQPKYSEQYNAMQATLKKLTIDYSAARAVAEKQLLQNNNVNNNSNTTINNFGNTSGQTGAVQ
jgi:chemotaxis protein histidine kinase CheA